MSTFMIRPRLCISIVAGVLCITAPALARATSPAAPAVPLVKVFPDRFEAGGQRFADIDKLEAWVKATGARGLVFHSCMSADTKMLASALERFRNVYLDVRWSVAGEAGCPADTSMTEARSR